MNFNYKHDLSIVQMDANYKFFCIDVGRKGRISDGGIFTRCSLHRKQFIQHPTILPGMVPYTLFNRDRCAISLKTYLLKTFNFRNQNIGEKVFNHRLSTK